MQKEREGKEPMDVMQKESSKTSCAVSKSISCLILLAAFLTGSHETHICSYSIVRTQTTGQGQRNQGCGEDRYVAQIDWRSGSGLVGGKARSPGPHQRAAPGDRRKAAAARWGKKSQSALIWRGRAGIMRALEEGTWGRNLGKVSPPLARPRQINPSASGRPS